MKIKTLLLAAIAILAISCSKDDNDDATIIIPISTISAEEFATLTPETIPDYDTWTITGDVTMTPEELGTMMSGIDEALGEREISLVFEDEEDMSFFESEKPTSGWPISRLNDNIVSISAENVESLNDWVFACCNSVRTFDFPNLKQSFSSSFYYCLGITNVSFPSLNIVNGTFFRCFNLEYADLPEVMYIGLWSFAWNYELSTLKLTTPNTITFQDCAFQNFTNIENCTLYLHYNNSYLVGTDNLINIPSSAEDDSEGITFGEVIFVNSSGAVTNEYGYVL